MSDPKNDESKWGPGEMADGSINIMTEEEAIKSEIESLAEEKAFLDLIRGGSTELDLDSMSIEELEKLKADIDESTKKG